MLKSSFSEGGIHVSSMIVCCQSCPLLCPQNLARCLLVTGAQESRMNEGVLLHCKRCPLVDVTMEQ